MWKRKNQRIKTMMRKLFLLFLLAVLHCSMGMAANEYDELDHLIGQRKAITDKKLS